MTAALADLAARSPTEALGGRPFRKVLVANRGEIAIRVCRTLREMGIRSATVHSDADRGAPHARAGDEAVAIGPAPPSESYLNAASLLAAAKKVGADAIHPGYGFLSESAAFARKCREAGTVFIGPSPESMAKLGDKAAARTVAAECGIPLVPGVEEIASAERATVEADRIGYPVLLKASGGGGGRGMRLVASAAKMRSAYDAARREAAAAFGNDRLLLEKYVHPARHVEVQILADGANAVALGERECSLQRRHQKLIEESPSVAVTADLRAEMEQAAVSLARAAAYAGTMTAEFLLGPGAKFYFLEVNTRLQVEHTVTEMRSGLDLVRAQILIAAGRPLAAVLADSGGKAPPMRGHAIEARLCAEDPYQEFLPQTGRILFLSWPEMEGLRVDSGIAQGQVLGSHYDSLLAKIIAHGRDREEARARLLRALREAAILGIVTNQSLLIDLLDDTAFQSGTTYTHTVESRGWAPPVDVPDSALAAAASSLNAPRVAAVGDDETDRFSPWRRLGPWGRWGSPAPHRARSGV